MHLEYTISDTIGTITIVNATGTNESSESLSLSALSDFLATSQLKGIVLKGEKDQFYSGYSMNTSENRQTSVPQIKELLETISGSTIPVAAVISGKCFDEGLFLALSCAFRFAVEHAEFGFTETFIRTIGESDLNMYLQDRVPDQYCRKLLISGSILSGKAAHEKGIVDEAGIYPEIETQAYAFLNTLTEKRSSRLIRTIMQSMRNGKQYTRERALEEEGRLFDSLVRNLSAETN